MLTLKNINKRYLNEHVLENIDLTFPETGFISLIGPSGCGKSTLLHIIAGLDHDYSGQIEYGTEKRITIIFQDFHLIPWLSVTQNIHLYDYFHHSNYRLKETLFSQFKKTPIASLSLGQRQRVAIQRSLYYDPEIILCDEPTASLDASHADIVLKELKDRSRYALVIFVSHDIDLVKRYSDQIIEMRDGMIIKETLIQKPQTTSLISQQTNKFIHFPILTLTIRSFLSDRKRFFQMSFALSLALLCLMVTLTFSFSFRDIIYQYLSSILPQNSITYKLHNDDFLPLTSFQESCYQYLNLEDYDLMGLSANKERYLKNEVLFISDDTSYTDQYIYGKGPTYQDEIALPLSTAKKLAQGKKVESLLNTTWTVYYKHQLKIKGKQVRIVGIAPQVLNHDAFYMKEFSNYYWIQDIFHQKPVARFGMLYYKEKKSLIKTLRKKYPEYDFKVMGETTKKTLDQNMDKIQYILILFSFLTVFSSLFMIMEIMILHAVHLKKDHAIMKAYGEKKNHILKISFCQCCILHFYSYFSASLFLLMIMKIVNMIIPQMIDFPIHLTYQPKQMIFLWICSFILVVCSSLFGTFYIMKLNPSRVLKMR